MKFLTLIVLVISVAATFIPCCEFDECQEEEIENSSQQDKKEENASCSPFSTCPTCAGAIIITKTIQLDRSDISKNKLVGFERSPILSCHSPSFWQPPRHELRS
jgi:hypothetical protein